MARKQNEQAEAARDVQQPEAEQAAIAQGVMPPPVEEGETVECAVLHDNVYGKHGEIIRLAPAIAEAARAAGYVDTHPNAIKFFRDQAE